MSRHEGGDGSAPTTKSRHETLTLGDLIAAAFDLAARSGGTPREVSRLATGAVSRVLRTARRTPVIGQGVERPS